MLPPIISLLSYHSTVNFLSIQIDRSEKTVKTLIRLLLQEQSDQGLHCLQFHLHSLDTLLHCETNILHFGIFMVLIFSVLIFRIFTVIFSFIWSEI